MRSYTRNVLTLCSLFGLTFGYSLYDDAQYVVRMGSADEWQESPTCGPDGSLLWTRNSTGFLHVCCYERPELVGHPEVSTAIGHEMSPDLLDELEGKCYSKEEDWWTYEVCLRRSVRQFHLDSGRIASEFHLGDYEAGDVFIKQAQNFDLPTDSSYIVERYVNGSECDLSASPRSTEVHFICGDTADTGIDSIQEIESCKYVITLSVPQLCPEQSGEAPSQAQEIACFPYHEPDVADST